MAGFRRRQLPGVCSCSLLPKEDGAGAFLLAKHKVQHELGMQKIPDAIPTASKQKILRSIEGDWMKLRTVTASLSELITVT